MMYNNKALVKQYADTGAIIPEYQLRKLSTNLLNTYFKRRILQEDESSLYKLQPHEYKLMPEKSFRFYIHPFIHEDGFISNELIKNWFTDKQRYILWKEMIDNNKAILFKQVSEFPKDLQYRYWQKRVENTYELSEREIDMLPEKLKWRYYERRTKAGWATGVEYAEFPPYLQDMFWEYMIDHDEFITMDNIENDMSPKMREKYWEREKLKKSKR
jgi:hypothetical protein